MGRFGYLAILLSCCWGLTATAAPPRNSEIHSPGPRPLRYSDDPAPTSLRIDPQPRYGEVDGYEAPSDYRSQPLPDRLPEARPRPVAIIRASHDEQLPAASEPHKTLPKGEPTADPFATSRAGSDAAPPVLDANPAATSSHGGSEILKKMPLRKNQTSHTSAPVFPSLGSASTNTVIGLACVLGLFLVLMLVLKRGTGRAAPFVSKEVFEVLGRAPFGLRRFVQFIRCGNKILVVAEGPDGLETLTEIVDPLEVDRLAGLCYQQKSGSASSAFRQVFQQIGTETASGRERLGRTSYSNRRRGEDDDA